MGSAFSFVIRSEGDYALLERRMFMFAGTLVPTLGGSVRESGIRIEWFWSWPLEPNRLTLPSDIFTCVAAVRH